MTSLRKKIAAALERHDEVIERDDSDPDAADEFVDTVRSLLENEPDPEELNFNNPIARLQERAQAKHGPMPEYTFKQTSESHTPTMTCTCVSEGVTGTGKGKNKQDAKRRAALAVLEKMHAPKSAEVAT